MKKLKPLRYGPFEIIEQVNENAFRLKLPPYMQINSVVNVENLKLFKPSMLDEEEEHQVLPTIEDLAPHGIEELKEDIVLQHKEQNNLHRTTRNVVDWSQGTDSKESKWYERNQIASKFPHLSLVAFGDQNPPNGEV
jgi:hypothetical protein